MTDDSITAKLHAKLAPKLRDLQFDITPTTRDLHGDEIPRDVLQKACEEFKADVTAEVRFDDRILLDVDGMHDMRSSAEAGWAVAGVMRDLLNEALDIAQRNYDNAPMFDPADGKRIAELRKLVIE